MKPFFSPLVREKVKTYFENNELTAISKYVDKYSSLWSIDNNINTKGCTEEITYFLFYVIEQIKTIQLYTAFNQSHVYTICYSLQEKTRTIILTCGREQDEEDDLYNVITFDLVCYLCAKRVPDLENMYYYMFRQLRMYPKKFIKKAFIRGDSNERIGEIINEAFDSIDLCFVSPPYIECNTITDDLTLFILEEKFAKEHEAQSKKINVITWNAIFETLNYVNHEHLDAFHSFFTKLATKYTQDNKKLRNNLEKLNDRIDDCKKLNKATVLVERADNVIDNHDGGIINNNPYDLPF